MEGFSVTQGYTLLSEAFGMSREYASAMEGFSEGVKPRSLALKQQKQQQQLAEAAKGLNLKTLSK